MGASGDAEGKAAWLFWVLALAYGALVGDLSPERGAALAAVGAVLLTPWVDLRARVVLSAIAGGLLTLPAQGTPLLWGLLLASALLLRRESGQRLGWAVGGALGVMVVFPFLENTTLGEIGGVGLAGFLVGLSAPPTRTSGLPILFFAGFAAAQGYQLQVAARTLPIEKMAPVVASRGADRLRPLLAARAAKSLALGDYGDAIAVLDAFPSAHILGQKLARSEGSAFAVASGWRPHAAVEPSLASEVAWALWDAGHPTEALLALGDAPGQSVDRALLEAEPGAGVPAPAEVPDSWVRAPGLVLSRDAIVENESIAVILVVESPATTVALQATGQPFLGPPELDLSLSGLALGTVQVPEDLGTWTFDHALAPGVYRLVLRYANDHRGDGGDRNIYGVRVEVR